MSIASGSIVQVAWVVTDLDAAEGMFTEQFETGPWTRLEAVHFGPDSCTYRGQPGDFTADISLAYSGDMQLELIRPVSGDSIYTEFLSASGPGLHHVCYRVDDIRATLAALKAAGVRLIDEEPRVGAGGHLVAFVHPSATGGVLVELAEDVSHPTQGDSL